MSTPSSDDLSSKVLERITHERVAPRPRWQVLVTNAFFWLPWIASTLIAALAVSAIAFAWTNAGWESREITHTGLLPFLFEMMPLVWLMALAVLLFVAYENMRHTAMGYRYPFMTVIGFSLFTAVLVGFSLFLTGVGGRVEEEFGQRIPLHRPVLVRQQRAWVNPARGLLAGEVVSIDEPNQLFLLKTSEGAEWQVATNAVSPFGRDMLTQARIVRVIGLPVVDATTTPFHACAVFPWELQHGPPEWGGWASGDRIVITHSNPSEGMRWGMDVADLNDPCVQLRQQMPVRLMQQRMGR